MSNSLRSERLEERVEKRRQKELQRQIKEMAKLNEQERARLDVESHENELDVLLSVHKEFSEPIDWKSLAFTLPPHAPAFSSRNHLRTFVSSALINQQNENLDQVLKQAVLADEAVYREACARHAEELAEWARVKSVAERILAGDTSAFSEVVTEFSSFGEIANLGTAIDFKAHDSKRVECVLAVNSRGVIPTELKTLTAAGKVSVKALPKTRFHEIYQDHVCGCCLRVGREIFALLPVEIVLVTITVPEVDPATGHPVVLPVLSVLLDRQTIESLDFGSLDPSDTMANFNCRGDVKVSKKTGKFTPIVPHALQNTDSVEQKSPDLDHLTARVSSLRAAYRKELKIFKPRLLETAAISDQSLS